MRRGREWYPVITAVLLPVLLLGLGGSQAWSAAAPPGSEEATELPLPNIASGVEQRLITLKYLFQTFARPGTIRFSGQFTRLTGGAIPPTLQVILRHLRTNGSLIQTRQYSLRITSTGAIPLQTFPFASLIVDPGERLTISIKPIGRNLDNAAVRFAWKYTRT
ncbi:MAG TPA: hypothetical protein VGW35_10335 [Methylomirabilota bacterium]|jgi:hypothetical protein|nr:hypothetical protein [Methylomirabilota bacterium]